MVFPAASVQVSASEQRAAEGACTSMPPCTKTGGIKAGNGGGICGR